MIRSIRVIRVLLPITPIWSVCGRASSLERLRLDRAGRKGSAFARYDLMVFMAFDVLKINVQGSLLINEGQKVEPRVAVLSYDFARLIRIGGVIEALNNLFAVRA
jgi:hypothetical protein